MPPSSFRVQHHPDALRQYYALPTGTFQLLRSELEVLAELAMHVAPEAGSTPSRAAQRALPGQLEVADRLVQYRVEWERRTLVVQGIVPRAGRAGSGSD